jgi:hypothetical protein
VLVDPHLVDLVVQGVEAQEKEIMLQLMVIQEQPILVEVEALVE